MAIHGHQLQGLTPEPADRLTGELSTNLLRMTFGFGRDRAPVPQTKGGRRESIPQWT